MAINTSDPAGTSQTVHLVENSRVEAGCATRSQATAAPVAGCEIIPPSRQLASARRPFVRLLCVVSAAGLLSTGLLPAPAPAQPAPATVLREARNNCLSAVAKVVKRPPGQLTVIRQQRDASRIRVDVNVPEAVAPWACLTNRQGEVEDVHFKGRGRALESHLHPIHGPELRWADAEMVWWHGRRQPFRPGGQAWLR